MSHSKTFIIGHVGRDADLRFTGTGTPVVNFPVAADAGKDRSIWFQVSWYGKEPPPGESKSTVEKLYKSITKGKSVFVFGRLNCDEKGNPRTYTGSDNKTHASFELVAERVEIMTQTSETAPEPAHDEQEDIPF